LEKYSITTGISNHSINVTIVITMILGPRPYSKSVAEQGPWLPGWSFLDYTSCCDGNSKVGEERRHEKERALALRGF
jgi:hypothetical protein